ncbi:Uncharacterised protein (plasmid) [Metamycoplasma orale]|uniref:Uncharacterized protein n=1 Tax=Metamycoplasma orale TaxID=2121 RepID=A0A448ZZK8_METOS|nr:Uncharacterised protein [Metamycoplasma orale]
MPGFFNSLRFNTSLLFKDVNSEDSLVSELKYVWSYESNKFNGNDKI